MSSNKEKILEQAEKYVRNAKWDRALKEYQKLLASDPSDLRAKLRMADIYARTRDIPKALAFYRDVAENYMKENFHLKAVAVYKTILKLSPTLVEINEKLGDLYHKVGLHSDALNQYYIVASFYDNKGLVQEALQMRKKILEIDPSNTTGRIRLAELMQARGETQEALREYEKAAEILSKKNDRETLVEVLEKMIYFRADDVDMLMRLCHIYFEKREFKKALKRLEASPQTKKNLELWELYAEALLEERQVDAARKAFRDVYLACLEQNDVDRSTRIYSRILQEFSDDEEYLQGLETARKNIGTKVDPVKPHFRQDFEKTEMIDLSKIDEMLKKK